MQQYAPPPPTVSSDVPEQPVRVLDERKFDPPAE
jgi:hypothetical protein